MYLLGVDVGSSSVKAALLEAESGALVAGASSPETELEIRAERPGWAEQDPATWWEHVVKAVQMVLARAQADVRQVKAIGISYQMHGLVVVDKSGEVLRPAIIWCDSRAVTLGARAAEALGLNMCLERFLNSPGNFTASKLAWVKEHEPEVFAKVYKAMLPGDYIAMRMTGETVTTRSGLSEGILWDYKGQALADTVLRHYGIPAEMIAPLAETFGEQGELTAEAAEELGLQAGIAVSYRAGDQPNNAWSLKVTEPGEVAATAGTSGVVYGIASEAVYDPRSRVNTFVHVNHGPEKERYGVLLCVNGAGILNSWLKHQMMRDDPDYGRMNEAAAAVPVGAEGLSFLPYGNGAERTLENREVGASLHGLDFNRHGRGHVLRAAQEGIVYALNYGLEIMREMGLTIETVRAGNANMFLSPLFGSAFASVTGTRVELFDTDGAQGAARGAGLGAGVYQNVEEAFTGLRSVKVIEPDGTAGRAYGEAYGRWRELLEKAGIY